MSVFTLFDFVGEWWVLIKKVLMTLRNVQVYYNVCILAYVCRKIGMYVGM